MIRMLLQRRPAARSSSMLSQLGGPTSTHVIKGDQHQRCSLLQECQPGQCTDPHPTPTETFSSYDFLSSHPDTSHPPDTSSAAADTDTLVLIAEASTAGSS